MDKSVEKVDNLHFGSSRKRVLGIFAKQPIPGQVKTRLCPPLSPSRAAELYLASLRETVDRMKEIDCCDSVLCYSGDLGWFREAFPQMPLVAQQGEDLGARMAERLAGWLTEGYDAAVLIGTDTPDLPVRCVTQAFALLEQVDLVHGPALDGGYYLVGEARHQRDLYTGIDWSTDRVLAQTLSKAGHLQVQSALLEPWEDLDDWPALQRLLQRSPQSATALYLKTVLSAGY